MVRVERGLLTALSVLLLGGAVPVPQEGGPEDESHASRDDGAGAPASIDAFVRRAPSPPLMDGRLEDDVWSEAAGLEAFTQIDPEHGSPAQARTEVRLLWDDDGLYVAARMSDPPGERGARVEGMRRDFTYANTDLFGVVLDGFGDGRFAMVFLTNPDGVQRDLLVFDGRDTDDAWNGVWTVRTMPTEDGWSAEFAIPWSTLRYHAGGTWRANFVREARAIQETSGWAPWRRGIDAWDMTYAGTLEGLLPPAPGLNVQVVPYAASQSSAVGRGLTDDPDVEGDVGLDLKWAAAPGTVVDLSLNMDFAQAEVDRQVINLDRFSVFFPERRTFFLESANLFDTGLDIISPFYSRRIGLDDAGAPVPVTGGARLTHRSPRSSAGAMLVHQGASGGAEGTVFGVGRYSLNVGETGRIGGLVATRYDQGLSPDASASNTAAAVDFFVRPTRTLSMRGMVSQTFTEGAGGDGRAAHLWIGNSATWGYVGWLQEYIDEDWEPRSGFTFTRDVITTSPAFNLDLRPEWLPSGVRSIRPGATAYLFHRASSGEFFSGSVRVSPMQLGFQNGGRLWVAAIPEWQRLTLPFRPVPGLEIPEGRYEFTRWEAAYEHDPSANLGGSFVWSVGRYYDGHLTRTTLTTKLAVSSHAVVLASWERSALDQVGGADRTTHLVGPEVRLAASPRLELSGFWQYNTAVDASSLNLRLAWEFRPLSFLHVVYDDRSALDGALTPFPTQRRLIVKATWLWQP